MAERSLPNVETGNAIANYEKDRRLHFGRNLLKTGVKALAVGAIAVAAVLTAGTALIVEAPVGLWLAGGLALYGGVKIVEGAANKASS